MYLNTISALLFTLLPGHFCPPFSWACNCISLLMFSWQRSNGCARSQGNTYMQAILLHKLVTRVDTETKTGVHTCPCVHIHRGESESPQGKGRGQKLNYRALYAGNWNYVTDTRLTWLLNVIFQNVKSRTGNSSVCFAEHQNTLECSSLQRRWVRSAPVSKNHLEWRGVYSGCSRHMYTTARLSLPPWHVFDKYEI